MKPCSSKKESLTWLALGHLDPRPARGLREHLSVCPGCRAYYGEMSNVVVNLAAPKPAADLQASESFHRRLVERVTGRPRRTTLENLISWWQSPRSSWHAGAPALGAAALVVTLALVLSRLPAIAPTQNHLAAAPKVFAMTADPGPTLASYRNVADRSLETLDQLFALQAKQQSSPVAPIYTASTFGLLHDSD